MKQTKNFLLIASFIAIAILLYLQKCGGGSTIESIKIDTVWKEVKADTFYIPKTDTTIIEKTKYRLREVITDRFDTLYLPELQDVDTLLILADYFKSNIYKDTIKNQYGYIAITDTVNQNQLKGRSASTNLSIPEITKTITLVDKRNHVYIGAAILGNQKDFASGYEFNLSLKTKKDRIIEAGYVNLFNGMGYYKIGYRHKLSVKK